MSRFVVGGILFGLAAIFQRSAACGPLTVAGCFYMYAGYVGL